MNSDFNIKNYDNTKKREVLQTLFDDSFNKAESKQIVISLLIITESKKERRIAGISKIPCGRVPAMRVPEGTEARKYLKAEASISVTR